ncbi:hypothetical protein NPIL_673571 [Nephila pilipes]|uniref:K Homology domain-containing protein n=1 Tax=Nephila pilipes TaxID=299642 RepID=A0A8X6IV26_NEPPI|nr:hypothetical protein NPIL_673571 [Nephila pilipes]
MQHSLRQPTWRHTAILNSQEHCTVLGAKDSKVKNIQRQSNVTIKFSDREKPEDANKVTMNGDAHAESLEAEFKTNFEAQRDELKKHTKQQIFKTKTERKEKCC